MRSSSSGRLAATVSLFAIAAAFTPGAALAQDSQAAQDCANLPGEAERQECLVAVEQAEAAAQPDNAAAGSGDLAQADENQTIVVTGSRINRPNYETLQPAVVIDSEDIENRGFETLGQAINEQPAFGVPGASPVGAGQAGSFGSGQSFVNFLGLGDQRTLTLVNSRRFVSSNTASIFGPSNLGVQVDLNAINTKLVDRVETIAVGGAPIYGSDAIAGTVNVILKRDYEGIELDGQYGIAQRGDAANWRIRAIAGHNFADGRGNVTVSGEYNKGEGLLWNDRKITRRGQFYGDCEAGSQFNQCLFDNRRIPSVSENGIPMAVEILGFPLSPEQNTDVDFFSSFFFSNFGIPIGQADFDGDGNAGSLSDLYTAFGGFPGQQDAILHPVTGAPLQFDAQGNLIPIDFGQRVGTPGSFNTDFSGGNGYNLFNTQQLLTDTKRYNANILAQYEITDNVRLFGEGWYAYSKGTQLRNQPVYNSGLFDVAGAPDGNIVLSLNNPFLSQEARDIIAANLAVNPFFDPSFCDALVGDPECFQLGRANTDIYTANASTTTYLWRFVGGLDGNFNLGERQFNWEVVANFGRAKTKGYSRELVQQNFENAVNAVDDGSGNIVCRPGFTNSPMPTRSSNCIPLNLFGSNRNSQAALDYVLADSEPTGINKQRVFTASINGPVLTLPGGDLGIALGTEFRRESTDFDPDDFFFGGDDPDPLVDDNGDGDPANDRVQFGRSVPIFPVKGHYTTKEFFGELQAPIVSPANSIPGIRSLELHGAARYVDHSTAGSDWTWTIEGRWGIIQDIAVRGNFTRAIRAPAITEVFNPASTFFGFATDPCDADNLGSGPDPATRQANCAAAGILPTFQSLSSQRSFHQAIAGNIDLDNEKSKAWSVGVVLTPTFAPGLSITADWIDIKLDDAITSFSATQVANACYDDPGFPDNEFCGLITRAPNDQLSFVETRFFNASRLRYKGLLGALNYRSKTPFLGADSEIGVNISYQYLDTLTTQVTEDSEPTRTHHTIGYPKHSFVANLNYQNGPFGWFTSLNYTGEVDQAADEPEDFREHPRLDDVMFVNTGISFDIPGSIHKNIGKGMTFRVMVDNLFDTKPPSPVPAFGGSVTYFPGILGRYFRAGASVKF
jgi:outer membrane receptor protein involved in Fe transport